MLAALVKVTGPPGMLPPTGTSGVTVMVATNGVKPGFKAVNEAMFPVPAAARPIAGVLFVQLKTTLGVGLVKFTAVVGEPAQTCWFATGFTVAVGLTVIVKAIVGPVQTTVTL